MPGNYIHIQKSNKLRNEAEELAMREKLKASHSRYFDLYNLAPVGYCTLNENGQIIETNLTFSNLIRLPRNTLKNKPLSKFIFFDDQDSYTHLYTKLIDTKSPQSGELRLVRDDKTYIWAKIDASSSHRADGNDYYRVVISDITDRKEMENALRISEARYLSIIEDQSELIYRYLPDGRISFVNGAFARYYGKEPGEFIGKFFFPNIPEPDKARRLNIISAISPISPMVAFTHRIITLNGDIRWQRWTQRGIYSSDQRLVEYQAVGFDITEHKTTQEALTESEALYRSILNASPDTITLTDLNSNIQMVSPAALTMLGYQESSLTGQNFLNLVDSEDREKARNHVEAMLQGIYQCPCRYRLICQDNSRIHTEINAGFIKDNQGQPTGMVFIVRDITGQKKVDDKINALLLEKELLLKEVHHRVKNNMNTIIAFISLQKRVLKEPFTINVLNDTARRAQSMMVLYDKLYRSKSFTSLSVPDYLNTLSDEIIQNFPNSHAITIEKQFDDFQLKADVLSPLGLLINELLTNSMKYAFEGRESGTISISVKKVSDKVLIEVQDDGNGLPDHISLENTTGFGLKLVENLARQMKGSIRLERKAGTKFILEFQTGE